ncbi:hypothetical protein FPQ18DRAFT_301769 [Pyronema domesticum]|uniref:Similar to Uncharacterized protein YMR244W acc. no. Q04018 n=1 Tax=Pyronema omphalodes (strain CBS 100304) TaxID=1076935 RepID=U4LVK7_PYROM|nr:hypothetical protein FPQ18DRAFT_301769 [Pyronema domesticum]CCX34652.1 Similar to Uncharacterized protein YMR244W; acc. no. Q04018 [Pyronema omphalodes CBS 100304]
MFQVRIQNPISHFVSSDNLWTHANIPTGGNWCPYACTSGKLMNQWNPASVAYVDPDKEQGGLYCGEDGIAHIPFPDRDFYIKAPAKFATLNLLNKHVMICQTVLSGDEDFTYSAQTSASLYINYPAVEVDDACVWDNNTFRAGNWVPYTLGLNMREDGEIFATLGWNTIWIEPTTTFWDEVPPFGARIICEGVGFHDAPCEINPVNGVNQVIAGPNGLIGVGVAAACIVTALQTAESRMELFY